MTRGGSRGFTLVEVLVATVILAVMGAMAYRSVTEARIAVEHTSGHMERLRAVQRAMTLIVGDFRTLAPRPVRETIGDGYRAALLRDPNAATLVELSRAGWPNGAAAPRGTVQRVSYRLEQRAIVRTYWNVTDATQAGAPVDRQLLDDVERVEIRYLNDAREWVEQWPPLGGPADAGLRARPLAVEVLVVLADYGELRRLIEVSG